MSSSNPRADRAAELERRLEKPLLVAALLTIPAIAIEQSSAGEPWDTIALLLNWTIWIAFLSEVVVLLSVTSDRWRWLRDHPLDVAIVIFTPPFLPATLQAARVFRLLRLVRIFKAGFLMRRLASTEGVRDAGVLAVLTVLGGGAAFSAVEKSQHLSAWDGVWWAITTVTTVGYGEPRVTTDAGRIIAIGVMLAGIGFVAVLTAFAAERFVRAREPDAELRHQNDELRHQLDEVLHRLRRIEQRQEQGSRVRP